MCTPTRRSCYWFSNGCTVGCDKCDGTNNHWGHGSQQFRWKGMDATAIKAKNITFNPWVPDVGDMVLDNETTKQNFIRPNCDNPTTKPTICDPRYDECLSSPTVVWHARDRQHTHSALAH
jgi:hypothetical protein